MDIGMSAPEKVLRTMLVYVAVTANGAVARLVRADDRLGRLVEGSPTTLARDGRWLPDQLRREGLRRSDVDAALRRQNANDVSEVDEVRIEPGGAIVATLRSSEQAATRADFERLEAKLDRLLQG